MRVLNRLIKVLLLLVPATGALAVNVTNIEFSSLAGDRTEVRLTFDGSFQSPKSYSVEQPARISIDLPNVASSLQKYYQVSSGNTRSATVLSAGDRTRVVLNLTKLVPYTLAKTGNQLVILIGEQSGSAAEVAQLVSDSPIELLGDNQEISLLGDEETEVIDIANTNTQRAASQTSKPIVSGSKSVQQVDFRRGEEADGQVIIAFSDSTANADIHEESGNIVVRVPGFTLPETLQRRLDVVDFATAVRYINAYNEGKDAVFVIEPGSNYDYLAYQTNKVLTIDVKEVTQEEQEKRLKEKFPYNGERLSLNFQDIAVRSVLQLIADFTELNLVASDTIQGNITLRLKNVPWDQALDLVLKTKGLDKRQIGNVLLVAPAEEIAAREKLELEAQAQIEKLAPLSTEFIQINYAKAVDIVDIIQKQSKAEIAADAAVGQVTGGDNGSSVASSTLLSARGTIAVDERTNKIMVRDTASNLEKIRQAIAVFDVPVRQVLIEARIVVANSTVGKELGVRWGGGGDSINAGDSSGFIGSGSIDSNTEINNFLAGTEDDYLTYPNALAVNLPAQSSEASSFTIGFRTADLLLDLELSALESNGKAEIISQPKIMTADGRESKILSGTEIPYVTGDTLSVRNAELSLSVLPHITPDDRFVIDLTVTQDQVGDIVSGLVTIDRNQLDTQVLVDNGQTVVLGGIFQSSDVQSVYKTPLLGDLPFIGALFRRTTNSQEKNELLIFITPKLVEDQLTSH